MIIAFLIAFLIAIVSVAIALAILAMLLIIIVTFFSDKFKSPTDFFFATIWKVAICGALVTVWLWGYFFRMLS